MGVSEWMGLLRLPRSLKATFASAGLHRRCGLRKCREWGRWIEQTGNAPKRVVAS